MTAAWKAGTGSLRFRLLAGAAVWIALALGIAGLILSGLFHDHVHRRFEAEQVTHLDQLAALLEVDAQGRPVLRQQPSDPRFRRPLSGLYWQIGGMGAGQGALRSRSLWDAGLDLPADSPADGELHRHLLSGPAGQSLGVLERAVLLPDRDEPLRIAVAADRAELAQVTADFNRTLALSLAVLAAALILAALVQVQVGLHPLARLRDELTEVRAGRKKRFAEPMPDEIVPLVEDLNALIGHAEEVAGRGRLQAGNLAHALKTHLAVLANEAQAAGSGGTAIARRVEEMRRHLDHHMARARAAASRGVPGIATPVGDSVAALARVMGRLHAASGIAIATEVAADAVFAGEREDLDEMLGNLLDNACKWARGRVAVTCGRPVGGMLTVLIDDDGPGLPENRREAVLRPGVRLDESVPGSGLGLPVARDLAKLYGGDLRLDASPLGGLRVEIDLPAAAA